MLIAHAPFLKTCISFFTILNNVLNIFLWLPYGFRVTSDIKKNKISTHFWLEKSLRRVVALESSMGQVITKNVKNDSKSILCDKQTFRNEKNIPCPYIFNSPK